MGHVTDDQVLQGALERLERGWCKFESALDADGEKCHITSQKAVCWCLSGAVQASIYALFEKARWEGGSMNTHYFAAASRLRRAIMENKIHAEMEDELMASNEAWNVTSWNDRKCRTRQHVLDAIRFALEASQKED